jgi:hypothetical protein
MSYGDAIPKLRRVILLDFLISAICNDDANRELFFFRIRVNSDSVLPLQEVRLSFVL